MKQTKRQKESSYWMGLFQILLTIAFVVLKLTRFIDWSWWWVFAPLWLPIAVILVISIIIIIFAAIFGKGIKSNDE